MLFFQCQNAWFVESIKLDYERIKLHESNGKNFENHKNKIVFLAF